MRIFLFMVLIFMHASFPFNNRVLGSIVLINRVVDSITCTHYCTLCGQVKGTLFYIRPILVMAYFEGAAQALDA